MIGMLKGEYFKSELKREGERVLESSQGFE